jgi:hypothetical protein
MSWQVVSLFSSSQRVPPQIMSISSNSKEAHSEACTQFSQSVSNTIRLQVSLRKIVQLDNLTTTSIACLHLLHYIWRYTQSSSQTTTSGKITGTNQLVSRNWRLSQRLSGTRSWLLVSTSNCQTSKWRISWYSKTSWKEKRAKSRKRTSDWVSHWVRMFHDLKILSQPNWLGFWLIWLKNIKLKKIW